LLGLAVSKDIKAGTPVTFDLLNWVRRESCNT
jgi:hypothetical protein